MDTVITTELPYIEEAQPSTVSSVSAEEKEAAAPRPKWKVKKCPVVNYVSAFGILGFTFDGVPCQLKIDKGLDIGSHVDIQYTGSIDKGIKFKL